MRPIAIWIWLCACLNGAGWLLSALHQLTPAGYALTLSGGFAIFLAWKKSEGRRRPLRSRAVGHKLARRLRKPFPRAFFALAALAFLGGAIHAPTNYDALAYRMPRVLHWLDAGQWHWIHTVFPRLNSRGCGIEWLSAPLLSLLHTDRLLFLINIVSFLLLPGLAFSVFTRLGVRRRVAWHWMWIAPTGYCFLLQAASIGNDLFAAPFALASIDFALRARKSGSPGDVFTATLAMALLTGVKMTNLPLGLPWAIAIFPSLKACLRKPLATGGVALLAIVASALPVMFFNQSHYHDWTGMGPESAGMKKNPLMLETHNFVLATVQNFSPPLFPAGHAWERIVDTAMPQRWHERMLSMMEPAGANLHIDEIQIEEDAGLGFGVCILLLAGFIFAQTPPASAAQTTATDRWLTWVRWSPFIALIVMFSQANSAPLGRTIAPYYLPLLPLLLQGRRPEMLLKRRWWRILAFAGFVPAALLLVLCPGRPLFPVDVFLAKTDGATSHALVRARDVYSVYHHRNDAFAPVRTALPPDIKVIGAITADDPEAALWHPYGTRRVVHVCPNDTAAGLKAEGVEYVVVKPEMFGEYFPGSFEDWCTRMNARVVAEIPLHLRAADSVRSWSLVRLD